MSDVKVTTVVVVSEIQFYGPGKECLPRPLKGKYFRPIIVLNDKEDGKSFDCLAEPFDTELINPGDKIRCKITIVGVTLQKEDIWEGQNIWISQGIMVAEGYIDKIF